MLLSVICTNMKELVPSPYIPGVAMADAFNGAVNIIVAKVSGGQNFHR